MRISDWSSDVCSSDLLNRDIALVQLDAEVPEILRFGIGRLDEEVESVGDLETEAAEQALAVFGRVERLKAVHLGRFPVAADHPRIADGAIVELADRADRKSVV